MSHPEARRIPVSGIRITGRTARTDTRTPRVDAMDGDIGEDAENDDEDGGEQHDALDHRKIPSAESAYRQAAEARDGEQGLDEQRSTQCHGEVDADERGKRGRR